VRVAAPRTACYDRPVPVPGPITRCLSSRPEIRFALLFGSRARGEGRPDSDWDIAILLDDEMSPRERFRARTEVAAELAAIGTADVVVLNDADPLLAQRALRGELLVMADRRRFVEYFVRTMGLAEDQRYFDAITARGRHGRIAEGTFGRS